MGFMIPGEFFKALQELGICEQITTLTWVLVSGRAETEIRDIMVGYLPEDGRLFVAGISTTAAWMNTMCSSAWLNQRL